MTNHKSRLVFVFLFCLLLLRQIATAQDPEARVYFFTMDGCGPCAQMEPAIDELIQSGYPITKIDARHQQAWTQRFQVSATPTTIFVEGNSVVGRQSGIVDPNVIKSWVDSHHAKTQRATGNQEANASKSDPRNTAESNRKNSLWNAGSVLPDTFAKRSTHSEIGLEPKGTAEELAMKATVRIRVEDESGFSFGTGTIIHSFQGDSLVLTCGHLFRDSNGKGKITADINWLDETQKTVPGELIAYDAGANDVGLIVIRAGENLPSVNLAKATEKVQVGTTVFSIGCDKGEPPTIRRTKIKNHATYDGSHKYDIVGRPVIGRSGGGLFTPDGKLIGVCNAAVVNDDEGVYSSIENIHHQLRQAKLNHLFSDTQSSVASRSTPAPSAELLALAEEVKANQNRPSAIMNLANSNRPLPPVPPIRNVGFDGETESKPRSESTNPSNNDLEVIVLVRSKSDPKISETIVFQNPEPGFVAELRGRQADPRIEPAEAMANLQKSMPHVSEISRDDRSKNVRGQSPK